MPALERSSVGERNAITIARALAAQEISPQVEQSYRQLEIYAGQAYVAAYERRFGQGTFPSRKREYISSARTVLIQVGEASGIFDANISTGARSNLSWAKLNGRLIIGYRVQDKTPHESIPNSTPSNSAEKSPRFLRPAARLIPHGRIPVVMLMPHEATAIVSPQAMNKEYIPKGDAARDIDVREFFRLAAAHYASLKFVEETIHEKSHGVQRGHLPFQIGETWGYYMQRWVMKEAFGIDSDITPFTQAADFFDNLVVKYGDDPEWGGKYGKDVVFRLLMGELGDRHKKADRYAARQLMKKIKAEFTLEVLERLFPDVEWLEDDRTKNK